VTGAGLLGRGARPVARARGALKRSAAGRTPYMRAPPQSASTDRVPGGRRRTRRARARCARRAEGERLVRRRSCTTEALTVRPPSRHLTSSVSSTRRGGPAVGRWRAPARGPRALDRRAGVDACEHRGLRRGGRRDRGAGRCRRARRRGRRRRPGTSARRRARRPGPSRRRARRDHGAAPQGPWRRGRPGAGPRGGGRAGAGAAARRLRRPARRLHGAHPDPRRGRVRTNDRAAAGSGAGEARRWYGRRGGRRPPRPHAALYRPGACPPALRGPRRARA
jgi:hypothetical protein